jgi:site-specific recombinase XerD
MTSSQRRIEVSCVDFDEKTAVLFYDVVKAVVVDDLTDFLWSLSEEMQRDPKTITDAAYSLRRFWEALAATGKDVSQCIDSDIARFRDREFISVMSSSRSKQKERIAKNTVNIRIRLVYRFLAWLQANGRTASNSIGSHECLVTSSLPLDLPGEAEGRITRRNSYRFTREQSRYPLAYRRVGAKSKHSTQFSPSESLRYASISALHETASSNYLAHRNSLIIDIANTVGWRRESINSLTLGQVDAALATLNNSDYASITPLTQKFGYVEAFDVPGWLVERISLFVRDYLIPMAKTKGWKLQPSTRLFLGAKGSPLKERSITKIVSNAMRQAGAPRFAALHAFRHKFTNDEIADETRYRIASGLDTSAASIAATVSISLGHRDPNSIYSYVSRSLSAERTKVDRQRQEHLASIEQELVALKAKFNKLDENADLIKENGANPECDAKRKPRRK